MTLAAVSQTQVSEALERAYALALQLGEALRDGRLRPMTKHLAEDLADSIDHARAMHVRAQAPGGKP